MEGQQPSNPGSRPAANSTPTARNTILSKVGTVPLPKPDTQSKATQTENSKRETVPLPKGSPKREKKSIATQTDASQTSAVESLQSSSMQPSEMSASTATSTSQATARSTSLPEEEMDETQTGGWTRRNPKQKKFLENVDSTRSAACDKYSIREILHKIPEQRRSKIDMTHVPPMPPKKPTQLPISICEQLLDTAQHPSEISKNQDHTDYGLPNIPLSTRLAPDAISARGGTERQILQVRKLEERLKDDEPSKHENTTTNLEIVFGEGSMKQDAPTCQKSAVPLSRASKKPSPADVSTRSQNTDATPAAQTLSISTRSELSETLNAAKPEPSTKSPKPKFAPVAPCKKSSATTSGLLRALDKALSDFSTRTATLSTALSTTESLSTAEGGSTATSLSETSTEESSSSSSPTEPSSRTDPSSQTNPSSRTDPSSPTDPSSRTDPAGATNLSNIDKPNA